MGVEFAEGYEINGINGEVFAIWKYDITSLYNLLYLGCAFSFIVATVLAILHHKGNILNDTLAVRKSKDLHEREEFAFYLSIIVFLISIYCHTVEASNLDDLYIASRGIKLGQKQFRNMAREPKSYSKLIRSPSRPYPSRCSQVNVH